MVYLEHSIQDAHTTKEGRRRIVSRRLQYVEIDSAGQTTEAGYAPYLDYRPLEESEQLVVDIVLDNLEFQDDIESKATSYAITSLVAQHLQEVRERKEELIEKTIHAVQDRLTKEINYWDKRAADLRS